MEEAAGKEVAGTCGIYKGSGRNGGSLNRGISPFSHEGAV